MKPRSPSLDLVALSLFLTLVAVNVASAQSNDATAPAAAAPAAAGPAWGAPNPGDLPGAAKVGSGVAVDEAVKSGDMNAAGQKGVAAGVNSYMGSAPAAPAAATPPAGEAAPAAK